MKPKRPSGPRLGELLETRGRVQREILHEALRHQRASGGRIGTCLVELEKIGEDDLLHVLSDQLKVPFAPPEDLHGLPEEIVNLIPEKIARQRFSIPLKRSSTYLTVAMRDPTDLIALDELAFVTGKRIRPQVASEIRILEALSQYYGVELASRFVKLLDRLNRERFLWARDGATEEQPPAVVEQPMLAVPPRPPDARPPSPPTPAALPSPTAPARYSSGERPAPIVTHFAPGQQIERVAPPVTQPPLIVPDDGSATVAPPVAAPLAVATPVVLPRPIVPASVAPAAIAASATPTPAPLSSEEADARLRDPSGRDEIGQLLLDFARGRAASALLLMVRRDEAAGWLGFGPGLDDESVESCRVDLHAPSFVRALRDGAPTHRGTLAELPAHAEIRAMLGTNWATDLLALPLRVRERLVAVLVMTLEDGAFPPERIEELTRLVGKASVALELLVLKQKLHG